MPRCPRLASPEVRAALAAAGRDHRLLPADQSRAEADWEEYWSATRPVELSEQVTASAGQLAAELALRGADAVHLASLLAVGLTGCPFAVWDQRVRDGAHAGGARVVPDGA